MGGAESYLARPDGITCTAWPPFRCLPLAADHDHEGLWSWGQPFSFTITQAAKLLGWV
jgi:hypothetical protein